MELYHNSKCSKSRQAKELLSKYGVKTINYMAHPLSMDAIWDLLKLLKIEPDQLIRKNEQLYKDLIKDHPAPTRAKLVKWMSKHPKLIERPIFINGKKAIIGRPPEKVLEIL